MTPFNAMPTLPFRIVLTILLLISSAFAQEAVQSGQDEKRTYSHSDVGLEFYAPKHVHYGELHSVLFKLHGRALSIRDNGGSRSVFNIFTLGENLAIYDTEESRARIRESLSQLDVSVDAGENRSSRFATAEFIPKHLSLDAAFGALQPYARGLPGSGVQNLSLEKRAGAIIVREEPGLITEMREFMTRIDVPTPQALILCYVMQAGDGEGSIPPELEANLEKLVPQTKFDVLAMGMLRSSVRSSTGVTLAMQSATEDFRFEMVPSAYDEEGGTLTLAACEFSRATVAQPGQQFTGVRQVFSTATTIQRGEYTVIGAAGANPIYVVLHFAAIE